QLEEQGVGADAAVAVQVSKFHSAPNQHEKAGGNENQFRTIEGLWVPLCLATMCEAESMFGWWTDITSPGQSCWHN
ncbi:MAG: hypothetical protein WCL04_01320, partial [Verrucomicrobiota bacterium]